MSALTLRLPSDTYEALAVIAKADGKTVSDAIREAVAAHIAVRKADPEFAVAAQRKAAEWRAFADSCVAAQPKDSHER